MSDQTSIVEPLGNGRFRVVDGARATIAYGVADGPRTWIFLDGRSYVVEPATAGRRMLHRGAAATLASPMPATVARIAVAAGQPVAAGDVLVVLEAMKMELPITAPRAGIVARVDCRVGELVQPGVPLVVLEPEP